MRSRWAIPLGVATIPAVATDVPYMTQLYKDTVNNFPGGVHTEMLSRAPSLIRITNFVSREEYREIIRALVEAVLAFNVRDYQPSLTEDWKLLRANPNRYRMLDDARVAVLFEKMPKALAAVVKRAAGLVGTGPENVEALLSLTGKSLHGIALTNVHLDNFSAHLQPHRFASLSIFLEDAEDGPTVFPLMLPHDNRTWPGCATALESSAIENWHWQINSIRLKNNTFGPYGRRVEFTERENLFRAKVFQEAATLCETATGRGVFRARAGEAYFWTNYLLNGEDDIRTIHGGCSPKEGLKPLLTLFLRDFPGPFEEERAFWDVPKNTQQQIELMQLAGFQTRHYADLERLRQMTNVSST